MFQLLSLQRLLLIMRTSGTGEANQQLQVLGLELPLSERHDSKSVGIVGEQEAVPPTRSCGQSV